MMRVRNLVDREKTALARGMEPWMANAVLLSPECFLFSLGRPCSVPEKYRARVRQLLIVAYLNILNKNATWPLTPSQRHAFLTRVLARDAESR